MHSTHSACHGVGGFKQRQALSVYSAHFRGFTWGRCLKHVLHTVRLLLLVVLLFYTSYQLLCVKRHSVNREMSVTVKLRERCYETKDDRTITIMHWGSLKGWAGDAQCTLWRSSGRGGRTLSVPCYSDASQCAGGTERESRARGMCLGD